MRPRYETAATLAVQERMRRRYEAATGTRLLRNERHARFDYRTEDGLPVEMKRRYHRFGTYPTLWIATQKLNAADRVRLVIEWDDAMGFHDCERAHDHEVEIGGRTKQTRDRWDIEPMSHIHVQEFRRIA